LNAKDKETLVMTDEVNFNCEKAIREEISKAGINSLDGLISQLGNLSLSQLQHEDYLFMVAESTFQSSKPHKPPEMNLVVDGESHEPSVITQFNGHALYSTPGLNSKGDPTLYSFTTLKALNEHLRTARGTNELGTNNPDALPELSYYFEHSYAKGDWLQNGPGRAWSNLTRVGRGILRLGDWNDIISSVDWCRWDVSLYEHANYGGSQLYLRAGRTYYDLSKFGWNDRASSTVNWGRRL
jgi:hypothetical protein